VKYVLRWEAESVIKSRYVARLIRFVIFSAAAKRLKNALSEIAIGDGGAASARSTLLPQSLADQQSWVSHHENVERALGYWLTERYLTEEYIENADILDFGGGYGSLALLLLERGARSVTVLDPDLDEGFYRQHLGDVKGLSHYKGTIEQFTRADETEPEPGSFGADVRPEPVGGRHFDLVIASSVTEHVLDLAQTLIRIYEMLRPGGVFFTAHDNYYHPSGAHDNFMLRYGPEGFGYTGPECWTFAERCEASRDFRTAMAASAPWAWDDVGESALTPENCEACLLFKRTKPWAHLLYADTFNAVFPQEFFTSGRPRSGLNKITPFMLRQFILEAGFGIDVWHRNFVLNDPPRELLVEPYWHNEMDLKTLNIIACCRKRA
jgi:SAM-dependent methyltransferase